MTDIRPAEPVELDRALAKLEALHCEVSGIVKPGAKTTAYLREQIRRAHAGFGVVLVAVEGGDVVGALLAVEGELPYDHHLGKLVLGLGTYVDQPYRKLGLAGALYTEACELLRERGYRTYLGAHLVGNDNARRVIERVGFEPFEVNVRLDLEG